VSSAYLVFVAIDGNGKAVPLPPVIAESPDEKRRMAAAEERRRSRQRRAGTT
jgi:acyl-CoA hydrolase